MHHVYAKTISRECPARLSNANRIDSRVVKRVIEKDVWPKIQKIDFKSQM